MITKDDYIKFSGIDLEQELKNNYDISDPVNMVLKRIETTAEAMLKDIYDNADFDIKVAKHEDKYKEGMLWQINYIIQNGELYNMVDANPNKYLAPMAIFIWRNIGLCNLRRY